MTSHGEIAEFYERHIPAQWNATLEHQRRLAKVSEEAARTLEEMEAVRGSVAVRITGAEPLAFALDIERGVASPVGRPSRVPFLTLQHTEEDFTAIRSACGDSLLGFLGALAGLGEAMRLTAQRARSLRELGGRIALERSGPEGFRLVIACGVGLAGVGEEPTEATIRLDRETFSRLASGALDAQDAFLAGSIPIEGDQGLAIGLALLAMSPD